ncbi:MAG: DUF485 domain-containing protein [Candidatus Dormibacteraeota bacterium]|nr:DUF485 domain-containing protein [Candidatus Dormibacteraeota bacterium]
MDRGDRSGGVPVSGSPIRPGRQSAGERGPGASPWESLYSSQEFQQLLRARRNFIIPAVAFFLVYYFALPLGNGLAPSLMNTKIIGNINLAYLFALSEFVMAWILAAVYIRRANRLFDPLAAAVRRVAAKMGLGA